METLELDEASGEVGDVLALLGWMDEVGDGFDYGINARQEIGDSQYLDAPLSGEGDNTERGVDPRRRCQQAVSPRSGRQVVDDAGVVVAFGGDAVLRVRLSDGEIGRVILGGDELGVLDEDRRDVFAEKVIYPTAEQGNLVLGELQTLLIRIDEKDLSLQT